LVALASRPSLDLAASPSAELILASRSARSQGGLLVRAGVGRLADDGLQPLLLPVRLQLGDLGLLDDDLLVGDGSASGRLGAEPRPPSTSAWKPDRLIELFRLASA